MVSKKFAAAQQNKKKGLGFTPKANELEKKKLEAKKKQVFEEASDDDEDDDDDMEFDEESEFDEDDSDEESDMEDDSGEKAINTSAKNAKSPGGKGLFTIDKTPSKQTPGKQLAKQTPGKQFGKLTPGKQTPAKTPQAQTPGKGQNKSLLSAKASQLKQQQAEDDDEDDDDDEEDDDDDEEDEESDDEEAVVMTGKNAKSPAALGNQKPGKQQIQLGKTPQKQTPSNAQKQKSSTPAGVFKSSVQEDDEDDDEEDDEEDEEDSEEDEEIDLGAKNALGNNKTAGKQHTPGAQGAQKQTPGKQANQKQKLKSVSFEEDSDDDEDDDEDDDDEDDDDEEDDEDDDEVVPKMGKQSAVSGGPQKLQNQENSATSSEDDKQNKRLYIGNLPEGTTIANVKALSADIEDVILPGKKGKAFYAFAVFSSPEKVEQNYKLLQGAVLKGNALKIDYCGEKSTKGSPNKQASGGDDSRFDKSAIFLKDIPETVQLIDLATQFPDARFADIYSSGPVRNAVIRFSSPEDGEKYLQKSKTVSLKGKDVEINFKFATGRGMKRPFEDNRFGGNFRGQGGRGRGNFGGRGGRGNFGGRGRGNFGGQGFGGRGGGNQDNFSFKRQKW